MAFGAGVDGMELSGFKELDALLRRLPEKVARKYLSDAVREGGELIRQEVEDNAPVLSGELADSIVLRIARQRNTGGDPRAEVGPTKEMAHIARFNELGTVHQGAVPFMRPALESKGPAAIAAMADVLRDRLEGESGMSTIEEALVARAAAVAELAALVGSRIYAVRAPQGATMPCVTYQRISAPQRDASFGADTGIAWPRFQIVGWAKQYSEAKAVGTAIRHAFQRFSGTVAGVEILDGVIEMDEDIRDDEAKLWGAATDVTLKHRET